MSETSPRAVSKRSLFGLDLVNVFMADVRDGVGVYLAVYLLTVLKWDPSRIGLIIALPGIVSILVQSPAGAWIDESRSKRLMLVLASAIVAASCLVVIWFPQFTPILLSQVALGLVGPLFQPCVSAITLGLVGHQAMRVRIGRNESFNHAGNMVAAVVAVVVGAYISYKGIFYFSLVQCAAMVGSTLLIRERDIDHELARSATADSARGSFWHDSRTLLADRPVAMFILAMTLWNFANGAMLPLLGQKLGIDDVENSAMYLSICIIVAQAAMIGVAPLAAKLAHVGAKKIFLLSFALIPVRAVLFALLNGKYVLMACQVIDGLGAGIYGVVSILMMASLSRGSGRFNLLQGTAYAAMGVGGALSSAIGGFLASSLGYNATFACFAGIGVLATLFFAVFVREPDPATMHDLTSK